MIDPAVAAPRLTSEQLEELKTLLEGADTVELKLTVPDGDQRSAVRALQMDPLEAEVRQVFFFDTPDLLLNQHGVIVRARRNPGRRRRLRGEAPSGGAERAAGSALRKLPGSGWRSTPCPGASSAPAG